MKKIVLLFLGLIVSGVVAANSESEKSIDHTVTLAGLQPGEGRFIRGDLYENNKFKSGYYFCAGANTTIYTMEYFFSKNQEPFHVEHLTRFSICQDETLANCQEFATDKYLTFRALDGYLHNDVTHATVDLSPLQSAYQSCEPNEEMDELVKQSIHLDDRLFAHIG